VLVVGRATAVVLRVAGGTERFEVHRMADGGADQLVRPRIAGRDRAAVRQGDRRLATGAARGLGAEAHQPAELLGAAAAAPPQGAHAPLALVAHADVPQVAPIALLADHRLHRVPPQLGDLHDAVLLQLSSASRPPSRPRSTAAALVTARRACSRAL